jgi:rhodanese-related sulfurtransferase
MRRLRARVSIVAVTIGIAVTGCGYDGPRMTVEELKAVLDSGRELTVIDLRPAEAYRQGHLPGSINISRGALKEHVDEIARLGERAVLICHCGRNALASCKELRRSGIAATMVVGGVEEWQKAGYPLERGPGRVAF